jgi:hypothetical protein
MIITRSIINKNIKFHEYIVNPNGNNETITYNINDLFKLIDSYKNLLISVGANKHCNAVIADRVGLSQVAFIFACAELAITITIVDPPASNTSSAGTKVLPKDLNTKLNQLLPITFLLVKNDRSQDRKKLDILKNVALQYVVANENILDDTPNLTINSQPNSPFLKCTSSGSTGESKVIIHTHKFMYDIIHRNSTMYEGKMGIMNNLNHGSSPATYFLPGLVSEKVSDLYNILLELNDLNKATFPELDHMMFPYTSLIDSFLENPNNNPNLTLYTLSYIKENWVKAVANKKIKDVVSIFGTSETSGPIFLNKISYDNFNTNFYKKCDDFYKITIDYNNLQVTMPVYDYTTTTGDSFEYQNGFYKYLGRNNLVRINDIEIDLTSYENTVKAYGNCDLIIDVLNNCLYLAIWDESTDPLLLNKIDAKLLSISDNRHFISKSDTLKFKDFLTGVKIDKQLLRDYFRNLSV